MNEKTNNIYNIKLTTITPVSIGDGGVLSPLSDYIYEKGEIYLINHKKFEKVIKDVYEGKNGKKQNKDIIDDFVKSVSNNNSLKKFIEDNFTKDKLNIDKLNIDFEEVCFIPPSMAYGIENSTEIKTCIKNGNQPYISGSTLKGAIKGSLFYYLLNQKGNKGNIRAKSFSDIILNPNSEPLNKEFEYLDDFLFGNNKNGQKNMSLFKVRDTELMDMDSLAFYCSKRVYVVRKDIETENDENTEVTISDFSPEVNKKLLAIREELKKQPLELVQDLQEHIHSTSILETIETQTETAFEILIDDAKEIKKKQVKYKENKNKKEEKEMLYQMEEQLRFLQDENNAIPNLFEIINNFSLELINQEINDIPKNREEAFTGYRIFLSQQKKRIEEADTNKTCYLRIGLGKTYFYNSIGLAIKQTDEKAFEKLRKIMDLRPDQILYPKTRTLLSESQLPLGWIKLEYQS